MVQLNEVELISTGYHLPGNPIPFAKVEDVLGLLDKASPKIQKLVPRLKNMIEDILKAKCCYFAIDPKTKKQSETNTDMSVKAIKQALERAKLKPDDLDLIVLGTPVPDYLIPNTTSMIQERLGIEKCVEMEIHSNCTAITKALQVAFDSIRVGRYKTVAVVYSQNPSAYLNSAYYNQEKVKPENLLLRWFLSDAAGCMILKASESIKSGIKILGVYNDSVGSKMPVGMWMKFGAANMITDEAVKSGSHHFGQDYGLVNEKAPEIGTKSLGHMLKELRIKAEDVSRLIVTLPSYKLEDKTKELVEKELGIKPDKWFSNVETKGYCGGASLISCVNDLLEDKTLKKGEIVIAFAVESSKWMNGGFALISN